MTDENGVPVPTTFDVRGDERETFEVSANTVTCDCSWVLDIHLVVDGEERVETVRGTDGELFRTSSSVNAAPIALSTVRGGPRRRRAIAAPRAANQLRQRPLARAICTPTIAALLDQGVTPQPLGPVTPPGLSENQLTETRCSWAGSVIRWPSHRIGSARSQRIDPGQRIRRRHVLDRGDGVSAWVPVALKDVTVQLDGGQRSAQPTAGPEHP